MNELSIEPLPPKARLRSAQRSRKLALWTIAVLVVTLLPFIQSMSPIEGGIHNSIEAVGLVLIGIAVLGRAWCTLYIGGRKAKQLVTTGPYSISRNPLYMFSFIGAGGVGAQTGSSTVAVAVVFTTFLIFLPVVLKEEETLQSLFAEEFCDYCRRVPRFWPRLAAWRDVDIVTTEVSLLWRTVRDGLVFFFAVPVFELVDWFQVTAVFSPVIRLP